MTGWPTKIKDLDPTLRSFWDYRDKLAVEDGLILKGNCIVIPKTMRDYIMTKLHTRHSGVTKCQLRARETVF